MTFATINRNLQVVTTRSWNCHQMVKEQDMKKKRGHWQRRVCKSEIIILTTRWEMIFGFYFHITEYYATLAKFLKWIPFTEELLLHQTKNLRAWTVPPDYRNKDLAFYSTLTLLWQRFDILSLAAHPMSLDLNLFRHRQRRICKTFQMRGLPPGTMTWMKTFIETIRWLTLI